MSDLPKENPDDICGPGGIDTAAESLLYDQGGRLYWWQNEAGEWVGRNEQHCIRMLKRIGLYGAATKEEKLSAIESRLSDVSENRFVTYAGPLAGWAKGFYNQDGNRFLVTKSPAPVIPEKGEFPTLDRLFDVLFTGSEDHEGPAPTDQRQFFFAWWRYAFQCLRECYPERGLCMVLAGDAGCGKTLAKEMVRMSFGGREIMPYAYMIGRDNFNAEMLSHELWTVDDEQADTSMLARIKFGAEIKKATANSAMRFRGMMREAITLTTFRRLFVCVNREPDRLMVLPPLDDDISGKMCILRCYNSEMMQAATSHDTTERKAFWDTLQKELPHFLYWLMNDWEMPKELHGRFGSKQYHHPDIVAELFTLSAEQVLLEQINRGLADHFKLSAEWIGSAPALRNILAEDNSPLSRSEIKNLPAPNWLGKKLRKLEEIQPDRFSGKRRAAGTQWTIFPPAPESGDE